MIVVRLGKVLLWCVREARKEVCLLLRPHSAVCVTANDTGTTIRGRHRYYWVHNRYWHQYIVYIVPVAVVPSSFTSTIEAVGTIQIGFIAEVSAIKTGIVPAGGTIQTNTADPHWIRTVVHGGQPRLTQKATPFSVQGKKATVQFRGINPFRAPKPLPILNPSNVVPKKGFPVVEGLNSTRSKNERAKMVLDVTTQIGYHAVFKKTIFDFDEILDLTHSRHTCTST